jgi:hypothetical protein
VSHSLVAAGGRAGWFAYFAVEKASWIPHGLKPILQDSSPWGKFYGISASPYLTRGYGRAGEADCRVIGVDRDVWFIYHVRMRDSRFGICNRR